MSAKEKWVAGDIEGARSVLEAAFDANPESEQIWLAAFKFEAQNGKWAVARQLLERARAVANTERVGSGRWMKPTIHSQNIYVDMDEISCLRVATRESSSGSPNSGSCTDQVSKVPEAAYDQRPSSYGSQGRCRCSRCL